ncbi:MAG: hypothetical protein FJ125_14950 [Deltaproteobacteria bacterium]|nr:hypothetical protein [Deltaproteobacteria bacterium]
MSLSREGPLRPPPRVGGTIVLHPLEGPAPGNPAEVLQRALAEARRRGYQVLPPVRSADVAAPAVVLQHDGGAILLVRRRGLLCLVHDPRLGEGVVRFDDVQRLHAGTYYPLRQPAQDQERGGGRR